MFKSEKDVVSYLRTAGYVQIYGDRAGNVRYELTTKLGSKMNETIKRAYTQVKDIDSQMTAKQKEIEQHQASIHKLAPEFNNLLQEKSRLIKLILEELDSVYPEESKLKVVE